MHRLVLALALVPVAFVSSAYAQTTPAPDVVKTLWCGEAFAALDNVEKSQVTSDQQAAYDAYVAAAGKLVDKGTQGYLDAGFTEEQVDKVKSDLVTEVTAVVTGQNQQGRFTPDDCNPLLQAVLVLPSSSEAPASAAPDASAPVPASSSADASAAPAPASSAASSSAQ